MQKLSFIAAGTVLAASLGIAATSAAAPAITHGSTGRGTRVSVRVEGISGPVLGVRTLAVPTHGSITAGGVAAGQCPATSAQGALDAATHGRWKGTWSPSYREYLITSILGNTPNPNRDYFEIFVNHVAASTGACDLKLRAGDQLLFAAVPDSGRAETPLEVTTTRTGHRLTARVVGFDATGRATPLKGATVSLGGRRVRTGAHGTATLEAPRRAGLLIATAPGYIRDETGVRAR